LRHDQIKPGKAAGVGNPIIYVGSATGRDGLAGAAFASRELTEESQRDRPAVQVGDPFMEKLLLEACLEVMRTEGLVVGIQDMGAAGLTCSTCETASRGGTGNEIDLNLVPKRETGMTPYEILLSESQERMLVVAKKGHEDAVRAILTKWDLTAAVIGEVIAEPVYRVTEGSTIVAEFPGSRLVTDCPSYSPAARESNEIAALRAADPSTVPERPEEKDPAWTLEQLLSAPTIASKAWAYRQYDSTVRTNTVIGPGGDAAVLRVRGTNKAIAVKTDCNGRYVYLDPRVGGRIAVAEAARNVACTGARPMAITNCLNFGNPTRPEVFYQLKEAVAGMGEACRALGTPVTGGNVSLYNESPSGAVYPTPVIGMVGLIDDLAHITRATFHRDGDAILLLGEPGGELGGTEYLATIHGKVLGPPPKCDVDQERNVIDALLEAIRAEAVSSAHDCSDGGLAVALAECCIANPENENGAQIDLSNYSSLANREILFGESQGRIVVSSSSPERVLAIAAKAGVACARIGTVVANSEDLTIKLPKGSLRSTLLRLHSAYHETIPGIMARTPEHATFDELDPVAAH
ncbi:MAG TPA: phosphoribosylformylglycinamidine synthase subunit PurL, partial [Gemmatimonadaceae bacterium]